MNVKQNEDGKGGSLMGCCGGSNDGKGNNNSGSRMGIIIVLLALAGLALYFIK